MPTWLDEWTLLYVIFLTVGYIAIFAFLDRHNRRKKNGTQFDKPGHEQQIPRRTAHPTSCLLITFGQVNPLATGAITMPSGFSLA